MRKIISAALQFAAASCCLANHLVFAQAWLPEKGEGSVSIVYQNLDFTGHFMSSGEQAPMLPSLSNSVLFGVSYGLTDRLAASVDVPYITTKYTGSDPPLIPTVLDDGTYHGIVQDFRFDLRYSALRGRVALAPSFTLVVPSHDYQTVGETAQGRNLLEGIFGINVGTTLDPVVPDAYVHGRYSYAVVEKVQDIPLNRSNVDLELGYFVSRSFSVRGFTAVQRTHGGINFPAGATTPVLFLEKDRILRNNYWHVGGGASYAISPTVDLQFVYVKLVAGSDTHSGRGLTFGTSWRFSRAPAP